MAGYDQASMGLGHPLDDAFRTRLRTSGLNQQDVARSIGRHQSWLNRYMHGAGHATVDDVVRILALLIGIETQPLSVNERRLLKSWRAIEPDRQEDALAVLETVARGYRPPRPQESTARGGRTPPATTSTRRGRRKAAGE